jgi:hypothetical protein
MRHATARKPVRTTKPQWRAPASDTLEGALHPMHRELLARWSASTAAAEPKLPVPIRFAIAIGSACAAWGLVAVSVWSIAQLVP